MNESITSELVNLLSTSDARLRKHWCQRIIDERIPVLGLMSLLHAETKTAQRFTWLIGDLLQADADLVAPCLPLLFSLHDQMSFPGMQRTVGKSLYYCGVPREMEDEVIPVLVNWLKDDQYEISIKHYASKVLFELAEQARFDAVQLDRMLLNQSQHRNRAHASRMSKLRSKLNRKKKPRS